MSLGRGNVPVGLILIQSMECSVAGLSEPTKQAFLLQPLFGDYRGTVMLSAIIWDLQAGNRLVVTIPL